MKKLRKSVSQPEGVSQSPQEGVTSGSRNLNPDCLQKSIFLVLLFSVLILGITLRIHNLAGVQARSPDEGIYTQQARIIARQGTEGIKSMVREYNMNRKLWIYPNPLRVGYLWPFAAVMKMTGSTDVKVGAYFSCFFSILSLLLLIALGLRFFNRWITLYGLLFMSVSPLSLAIARRTWQDAMLGCVGLLLIYISCKITRARHKAVWYIPFVIVGSYCILIKDSGALIYILCIAWLLWILLIKEKSFLKGTALVIFSAAGAGISLAYLAHATGGISNILEVMAHFKEGLPDNAYAIEYQSCPWHQFFRGFWIVSPVNTILCLLGIGGLFLGHFSSEKTAILPGPSRNSDAILGIIFFMIMFTAIVAAVPYGKNLRYVSVVFAPFYLIGGFGLWCIISQAKTRLGNSAFFVLIIFIAAGIIIGAVNDYRNFKKIFVKTGIKDTSIRLLVEASR